MQTLNQIAREAHEHDDVEVFMIAMFAAEDAACAHGALEYGFHAASADWLDVWKNSVAGQLVEGGKYVTPATVAYYAARGIRG